MNYILYDSATRQKLLPFTFTRPVADIRFGILTIREKWEKHLQSITSSLTENYLSKKYPLVEAEENILINGSICPNPELIKEIKQLKEGQALVREETVIAMFLSDASLRNLGDSSDQIENIESVSNFVKLENTWDIFRLNADAIRSDFDLLTKGRKSEPISKTNSVIAPENIFVEEGAKLEYVFLNASEGPIYVGANAVIEEGAKIRGPFALGENATIKMGARIYGGTTVGPHSKVGGEVNESVIFGYSSKAHDGFLGHSVIGEWCNLGADTNTSNLKNTYEEVKLWSYADDCFIPTGLQFCGTIMADHTKCGINTMFNTGTVIGVYANIFGAGYQRNFIPSFSWGGTHGFIDYDLRKALKTAEIVYARRAKTFDTKERQILQHIYNLTYKNRRA